MKQHGETADFGAFYQKLESWEMLPTWPSLTTTSAKPSAMYLPPPTLIETRKLKTHPNNPRFIATEDGGLEAFHL